MLDPIQPEIGIRPLAKAGELKVVPAPFGDYPAVADFVSDNGDVIDNFGRLYTELQTDSLELNSLTAEERNSLGMDLCAELGVPSSRMNRDLRRINGLEDVINTYTNKISRTINLVMAFAKARGEDPEAVKIEFTGTVIDEHLDKVLYADLDSEGPLCDAHVALVTETAPALSKALDEDQVLLEQLASWFSAYNRGGSIDEETLYYLIVNDRFRTTEDGGLGIAERLYQAAMQQEHERATTSDAIADIRKSDKQSSTTSRTLKLIEAISGKTKDSELADIIDQNLALLPTEMRGYIETYKSNRVSELSRRINANINRSGEEWQLVLPPRMEVAARLWDVFIGKLPDGLVQSRRLRTKRSVGQRALAELDVRVPELSETVRSERAEEKSERSAGRWLSVIKKDRETGHFFSEGVRENADETRTKLIDDFCREHNIYDDEHREGLEKVLRYIEDTTIITGSTKYQGKDMRFENGFVAAPLALKPKDIAGMSLPTRLKNKLRIEYVLLEDDQVGIVKIFFRTDQDSKTRNRRRR